MRRFKDSVNRLDSENVWSSMAAACLGAEIMEKSESVRMDENIIRTVPVKVIEVAHSFEVGL